MAIFLEARLAMNNDSDGERKDFNHRSCVIALASHLGLCRDFDAKLRQLRETLLSMAPSNQRHLR